MASVYTYPRIDELSLNNLIIISEAKRSQSRGVVYSTKSTTLGEVVELVVDTLAVRGFDESIKTAQIDIQTDLLNFKSRLGSIEERLNDTKIALEAEYKAYTDGLLTSYSTASATQQLIVEATEGLATSQSIINLSSRIFDPITNTLSESFANSVMTTESTTDYASAGDVTKLNAQFSFNESGDITGISSANVDIVRNAVAGDGYASAVDLQNLKVVVEGEDGESGLAATVQSIGEAQAGVPKIFNQDDAPSVDNPTNSVWYDTNDGNKAYILEESDIPTAPKQWVELTDERLGNLDNVVSATRSFIVDANGNVAGMKIGANDVDGGYISFLADSFRIYNGEATETPFEIINGTVKIKSANIGTISFGDLDEIPTILTTTIIYADNAVGANASTTKETRTHIAFYNDVWVDGDSVAGITFDKIAGADGTSVTILGSLDTVDDLPTSGNTNGDGYLIGGSLYVWDGSAWIDVGNIQGPAGVNGINGTNGLKTASGVIFYQLGSSTPPITPSASGVSYNFNTGSFTGLNSNWGTQSPEMTAGTASNKYWTSRFTVIESSPGSGTGTPSFATPVRAFAFDQVVTFNSLGSAGTTVIDGGRITTGTIDANVVNVSNINASNITTGTISADRISTTIARTSQIPDTSNFITTSTNISGGQIQTGLIKNSTYPHSVGHSGFSTAGMGIDLDNGSIHAEQFYINSDGTSNFKGSHSAGSVGSWVVDSSGSLQSSASNPAIVLSPNSGTAGASEKIRISATNLSTISPSAGSSMAFGIDFYTALTEQGDDWSDISTRTSSSGTWASATSGSHPWGYSGTSAYIKYVLLPETTFDIDAFNTANNTPYTQHTSGDALFTVPYKEGVNQTNFELMVQQEFLYDHGARWAHTYGGNYSSWEEVVDTGEWDWNRTNTDFEKTRIITWNYQIHFTAQIYRKSGSTKIAVGNPKQHLLEEGNSWFDLNDFLPYYHTANSDSWDFMDELTTVLKTNPHHHSVKRFGSWDAGYVDFSENLTAGDYVVDFKYKVRVYDIKVWGTSAHNDISYGSSGNYIDGYASGARYFGYIDGGWSAAGEGGTNNIVFKGAAAQTAIGLNGTQIVGNNGYIALGEATSTNSVGQFWGDVDIIGALSVNTTSIFSDERLKENIKPIKNPLQTIKLLNPVTYRWDRSKLNMYGDKHGFIAQEVKGIVPSIVTSERKVADLDNVLGLEYNSFIAINTAAIKELIEKIETLEQEIQILKNK